MKQLCSPILLFLFITKQDYDATMLNMRNKYYHCTVKTCLEIYLHIRLVFIWAQIYKSVMNQNAMLTKTPSFFSGHRKRNNLARLFVCLLAGISVAGLVVLMNPPEAYADSSCQGDVAKFNAKRKAISDELNALSNHGKSKMDPIIVCPKLRSLAAVEKDMLAYLTSNKDWCLIPDDAIKSMRDSQTKSSGFAQKACDAAAQAKKAQEQAAQGIGGLPLTQKLPGGPL